MISVLSRFVFFIAPVNNLFRSFSMAGDGCLADRDCWMTEVWRSEKWSQATRERTCVASRIDLVGMKQRRDSLFTVSFLLARFT